MYDNDEIYCNTTSFLGNYYLLYIMFKIVVSAGNFFWTPQTQQW